MYPWWWDGTNFIEVKIDDDDDGVNRLVLRDLLTNYIIICKKETKSN